MLPLRLTCERWYILRHPRGVHSYSFALALLPYSAYNLAVVARPLPSTLNVTITYMTSSSSPASFPATAAHLPRTSYAPSMELPRSTAPSPAASPPCYRASSLLPCAPPQHPTPTRHLLHPPVACDTASPMSTARRRGDLLRSSCHRYYHHHHCYNCLHYTPATTA